MAATGLARPTAHRLAVALEHHRLVARDLHGRFILGPRLGELSAAAGEDQLLAAAGPILNRLRETTGESAQLYRRQGDQRICVAAAERMTGLRDTVPVGSALTMRAGSAAQVLMAWEEPERLHRGLREARFSATALSGSAGGGGRRASGSANRASRRSRRRSAAPTPRWWPPCRCPGPTERLSRQPGRMHAAAVLAAAAALTEAIRRSG